MRIPRGLVHKSSQTNQRSQLLSPHSALYDKSKRTAGDSQAAVRTPPSRTQTSSPAYSSSTFNTGRKESVESLLRPPEACQKKHVSETHKNKTMHERSNGVDFQAEDVPNLRPHIGGGMDHEYRQQGLTEKGPEGRVCAKEQADPSREVQKHGIGEQKLRKAENNESLKAEHSLMNRGNCPTIGHNPHLPADTKDSCLDAHHGLSGKGRTGGTCCNLDMADENVYINPQIMKENQAESCKGIASEPPGVGSVKEKMTEGDVMKAAVKNDSETQFFDILTQKSAYFDVATQMSPADSHRLPSADPQSKPVFVTERMCGLAVRRDERGFTTGHASPSVRPVTTNPKVTGNMFITKQYEITKSQLCEYGSTGDHFGRKGGCHPDALYTRHQHGNAGPIGVTGIMKNEVPNATRYDKHVCSDPGPKGEDQTSYQADSLIFDGESLMPPPPYGYHVRRHYSNPDSTTNVCKIMQFDSFENIPNSRGLLNSNDLFSSRKVATAFETDNSSSSSSEVWQSLMKSQPPLKAALPSGRGHPGARRIDTERKKRPRKFMIIGKVKCAKRSSGKQSARTQLQTMREHNYEIFGKSNEAQRDSRLCTARRVVPVVVTAARKTPEPDGKYIENVSPRTSQMYPIPGAFMSLDDGSKYCKLFEYDEKHTPHLITKRKTRHRSALKINAGINIKRVNLKGESGDGRKSAKRLPKTAESRSCLNMALESNHNSPDRQRGFASQNGQLELLPSYFMNMNSNAGISDQNAERVSGGNSQVETVSVEDTHSTDQYFSVHGDSEIHEVPSELDSNLSPSFTNEGEDVITVISLGRCEPSVNASTSNDQLKSGGYDAEAETQQKAHNFSDSDRDQKKFQEQANSEKSVDFRGDSHFTRNTASLTLRDPYINTTHSGRHKKKAKTTETAVIKQENSMSKKTSATVASREWRKLAISKTKQEKQKQQVTTGDVYKAFAGAVDKSNKPAVEIQRGGRVGKVSDAYGETFETKIKAKCSYEPYLDYIAYKETPHHGRAYYSVQGQRVKCTESDHHYSPAGIAPSASSKGEDVSHIKRLVSLPETMPSQCSPKKASLSAQYEIRTVVAESISLAESKSPPAVGTDEAPNTSVSLQQETTPCSSVKLGVIGKRDAAKKIDSPKKDSTDSPKKEIYMCPNKELNNVPSLNEDAEQTSREKASSFEDADQTVVSRICTETKLVVESPNCVQSTEAKKDHMPRIRDSPSQKYVDTPFKYSNKKILTDNGKVNGLESATTRDNHKEFSNGRLCALTNLSSKRKSVSRYKTHSRSPDGKRKKRNLKRIITEAEDIKFEKPKKLRNGEKCTDKKRKKRKCKLKVVNDLEGKAQPIGATELVYKSRSRSHECNQIAETTVCSVPMENALDIATSEPSLAFSLHSKRKKESRSASSTGRLISNGQVIHTFAKQRIFKYEDIRGPVTSSAETTSSMSGSNIPIMSAESLLPFPSTITKMPSKAVQLPPFPKIKKNEKDLQEAELGWNSTFSSDDKAAAEKVKQNQRRAMVRYYIVKPKPKKTEREVGVSKLKRPVPRLNPEGEDVGSGSEIDLSSEVVPPERIKPGQGKSVQFSDNIEDLEASKEEAANERPLRRPDSDSILHHPITKAVMESTKAAGKTTDPEIAAAVKILPHKKEEQRSPVLAPRKRQPVWLKKSTKDKTAAAVVKSNEAVKLAVGVPVKKLHSSDNILKASSRLNLHFYCPVKATVGSPKISNTSLTDKRKVTYKAWINSVFMAAPMNKATKKVVAKAGSPVDIKEIIEGSSVDAADHFKISKPLHDGDVRSARSVPSLAPAKPGGVDLTGGKKLKTSDDSRLVSQKKGKDRPRECWSPRSHSTAESKEQQITALKSSLGAVDGPTSPAASSNVDFVAVFKQKNGLHRVGDLGNRRRKDKKGGKKVPGESGVKWQALASQDGRNVSDLERVHYCGDMMELNVLNMGLAWVVQSVFNKLPFLNQRQHDSASISTNDLATKQQLVE